MDIVRFAVVLVGLSLVGGVARAQEEEPPRTLEALQERVRQVLERHRVPGAGLALVSRDSVFWAGGVGTADREAGTPVTARTLFRAGSISKSFVALALLKLQEEGRIDLEAPLSEVAPEVRFENPWEETNPVRVVHLLEHTAGFDDMHFNEMLNLEDEPDLPLENVLALHPHSREVRWPPGTRIAYANPGYGIAGYLVEKLSGTSFEAYVEDQILRPLGMRTSSFRLTDSTEALLARGYQGAYEEVPYRHIYLRPAGSLHTSPEELARFVQLLLGRGTWRGRPLVQPASVDRMEQVQTTLAAAEGLDIGYGLGNYSEYQEGLRTQGHDGGIDGFLSTYRYAPSAGLGYVILLNGANAEAFDEIKDLVAAFLFREAEKIDSPHSVIAEEELDHYEGFYQFASPRNEVLAVADYLFNITHMDVEDDTLYEHPLFGSEERLVPVSVRKFRKVDEPGATIIFFEDEENNKYFATGYGLWKEITLLRVYGPLVLFFGALLLMASSVVFALVWVPRKLRGKLEDRHLSVRWLPLGAVLAFVALVGVMSTLHSMADVATMNVKTVATWLLGWAFALLSAASLVLVVRSYRWNDLRPRIRLHALLVALACCGLAAYLWHWHLIGLRTWAW